MMRVRRSFRLRFRRPSASPGLPGLCGGFGLAVALGLLAPMQAEASPAMQAPGSVDVIVVGFVDVSGGGDPACPACDGAYGDADEAFALANPLPALDVAVLDAQGMELAHAATSLLGGLQTARLSVREPLADERFRVELRAQPDRWMLCFDDQMQRSFGRADVGGDGVRLTWRFYAGCERDLAPVAPDAPSTALPTLAAPEATATPNPAPTLAPSVPIDAPQATPADARDDDGRAERDSDAPTHDDASRHYHERPVDAAPDARSAFAEGTHRDAEGRLGSIRGRAFLDANNDGLRDADELGMSDVGVNLHGGGLQLTLVTGAPGEYGFDALGAGDYELFVEPGAEWRVTTPTRRRIRVAGDVTLDVDFGLASANDTASGPIGEALPRLPATGAGGSIPNAPSILLFVALSLAALAFAGGVLERGAKEVCP